MRHLLGMTSIGSRRCVDLDLLHIERSKFSSGALALVTAEIPGVLTMPKLRLYQRSRDGQPFVSGVVQRGPDGRKRSIISLRGHAQHVCTALAYHRLRGLVLEDHDPSEAPQETLWLFDPDFEALYGNLARNDDVVFDELEQVENLREHPLEQDTWIFSLTVAGEIRIEDCEIADLNAPWPTVLTPRLSRSSDRYANIHPESARRIAAQVASRIDSRRPAI